MKNRQWRVVRHVEPGETVGPEHFELVRSEIPPVGDNELLVRTLALGTSPAQRGYIDPRKSDLVEPGDVMRGRGIAVVEVSRHPEFEVGDWVNAATGWQEWSVQRTDRGPVQAMNVLAVKRVDNRVRPSTLHLGTLGSAAFTALYGLEELGEIAAGKTVVISAAAGGVGSMACQIAKAHGAHVIGIAGGARKCAWARETVGCDATVDYKNEDVSAALRQHCPQGVDIFFDNVGGPILNQVLPHLATGARVVVCGYISTDYAADDPPGPSNYIYLLRKRARMEGFVIWDHAERYPAYFKRLREWLEQGRITSKVEDVMSGIESMPAALQGLFTGANTGIRLVQVTPDDDAP